METIHTVEITVDILDDHPSFAYGLREILKKDRGLHIRHVYPDGEAMQALIGQYGPPDVLLVDIGLPGNNGYQCCQWLRANHPDTRVLAMTAFGSEGAIRGMLAFGARGFLTKGTQVQTIREAIRSLHGSGRYVNGLVPEALMRQAERNEIHSNVAKLTPRQFDVIALLDTGLTYKGIADRLFITESAVKRHFEDLYGLFGVNKRAELVAECHKLGLIDL